MRLLPLLVLVACSDSSLVAGADLGVDPGGSQDIALARELILAGQIPRDGQFTVEGLYSEHDLPLQGAPCEALLCPRGAAAWTEPVDGSGAGYLLQIGFGTSITSESFERAPLRLAVTIDASGSMADDLDFVKRGLRLLVDQLGPDDEMAIVLYQSEARVLQGLTVMDADGRADMLDAIGRIESAGSTNMEEGMALSYGLLAPGAGAPGIEDRLMLFTDVEPNTGDTSMDGFLGMARYYGAAGIGITVFGVDLSIGAGLQDALARTAGGNAYFLADNEAEDRVFGEEFDMLVTPLAYDLELDVSPGSGLALGEGLGMPVDPEASSTGFGAATLFLSNRDGGLGLTLVGEAQPEGASLATMSVQYRPVDAEPVEQSLAVSWEGGAAFAGAAGAADDLGVYRMAALTDGFRALEAGAALCDGALGPDEAAARVAAAAERLHAVGDELADGPVKELGELVNQLGANVAVGLSACANPPYSAG